MCKYLSDEANDGSYSKVEAYGKPYIQQAEGPNGPVNVAVCTVPKELLDLP
jgi:hypothetical protein